MERHRAGQGLENLPFEKKLLKLGLLSLEKRPQQDLIAALQLGRMLLRGPYQERERVFTSVRGEKMGNNSHTLKQVKLSLCIERNFSLWEQSGTRRGFQKISEIFIFKGFWDLDRSNPKQPNSDLTDDCVLGTLRPCSTWILPWTCVISQESGICPGMH